MKPFTSSRALAALTLIAGLSACGGSNTYQLGGIVLGLSQNGLVLSNGGATLPVVAGSTGFLFPDKLKYGALFDVQIQTQPAHQLCGVSNGKGSAGTTSTSNVVVSCALNNVTVGGNIGGLTTEGLQLTNGSDTLLVGANATTFVMSQRVSFGSSYGIAILKQPTGKTCSVGNPAGTITTDAAVTNITITCV